MATTMYLYMGDGINSVTVHAGNSNYPKTFYRSDGVYRSLTGLPDSGNLWINAYNDIGFVSGYGHNIGVTTSNPSGSWTLENDQYFTIRSGRTIRLDATQQPTYTLTVNLPAQLTSITFSNGGTASNVGGTGYISYSSGVKVSNVALSGSYLGWSGTLSWVNSDGTSYDFATVTNGVVSIYPASAQEAISCTGSRTITVKATTASYNLTVYMPAQVNSVTFSNGQTAVRGPSGYGVVSYTGDVTFSGVAMAGGYLSWTGDLKWSNGTSSWKFAGVNSGTVIIVSGHEAVECTGSRTITVTATPKYNHTVAYYKNDGSGEAFASESWIDENSTIAAHTLLSSYPSRSNYTFMGWSLSSNGSVWKHPGDSVTYDGANMNLYAVWEDVHYYYRVHYFLNDGSGDSGYKPSSTEHYQTDSTSPSFWTPTITTPTRQGYNFVGWGYTSSATTGYTQSMELTATSHDPNSPTVNNIYAVWERRKIAAFTYSGSDAYDNQLFARGYSIPTALQASRWNALMAKIAEVATATGGSFSYTNAVTGDRITASGFNAVRTGLTGLPGFGSVPAARIAGQNILASLYVGSGSLKAAINNAIDHYNNS